MAVAAHQDLYPRPVGANGAQQAAQKGLDLLAAGAFGRAQHSSDETALAIEHDDGLKAVFVVVRVEQAQLLAAVNRVERVVDIQHDPLGSLGIGLAIEIDHGAPHAQQGTGVGQVLQPGDRRLRAQLAIRRRQIERHLEHRIGAQRIGVVAVLITRRDHQQPKANDVGHRMRDVLGSAWVLDAGGHALGDAKAPLDLAQSQNPAVRGKPSAVEFDHDILARDR